LNAVHSQAAPDRSRARLGVLLAFVLATCVARESRADEPADPQSRRAPKADQADGIATPQRKGARQLIWIPRAILYIPRRTIELALTPVRLAVWALERWQLETLYYRVFFFEKRTFGLYPSARLTSGFGVSIGMRMVHRDLFRNRGNLDVNGMTGVNYGDRLSVDFHSGWLGRSGVRVGGTVEYRLVPGDRFFGIGNADIDSAGVGDSIDALQRTDAVSTRFLHRYLRGGPIVTIRLAPAFDLDLATIFARREFGPPEKPRGDFATDDVFDTRRLVGYETGVDNVHMGARAVVDNRRTRGRAVASTGWNAAVYAGYTIGLPGDPSRYARAGFDVQRFIDLWGGTRVLMLRAVADTVVGPMSRIPFVDLPTIGGPYSLRGHARDRFRDRIAAYGTAEYIYEIDHRFAGFLFLDTGRVWSALNELVLANFRLGYGGGVQLRSKRGYIGRVQFASSIEGGFHVDLNFSPPDILRDPR